MTGNYIEMRLMGSQQDLEVWVELMREMEGYQILEILEESKPYPNRGGSKQFRIYLKINLMYRPDGTQRSGPAARVLKSKPHHPVVKLNKDSQMHQGCF